MDTYEQEITQIQKILQENPKGMTVTDISRKININRNSVAKYLDIMRISGLVEMITFGPAKVFFPSRRIPISKMLNFTSDYILVFDSDLKINMINDTFLDFLKMKRQDFISQKMEEIILDIFKENQEIYDGITEALEGRSFFNDVFLDIDGDEIYFNVRIAPTTFEDGRHGVTLVIKNNTDYKIAEDALKKNQENLKDTLKKMNKK